MSNDAQANIPENVTDYYQALYNNTPVPTFAFDLQSNIINSNTAAQDLFGYSEDEFTQLTIIELVPSHLRKATKRAWNEFLETGFQESIYIVQTKDNKQIYVHYNVTLQKSRNLGIVVFNKITENNSAKNASSKFQTIKEEGRKLFHQALIDKIIHQDNELAKRYDSEKHFYNLFEHAPVPILEIDYSRVKQYLDNNKNKFKNGVKQYFLEHPDECLKTLSLRIVKEANRTALRFFKLKNADSLRKNVTDVFNDTAPIHMPTSLEAMYNDVKYFKHETQVVDVNDTVHTVVMRISTNTDDYARTFVSFEDISEIKQIQEELETRVKVRTFELEKANEELRLEIKSREQIAKDLRHSEARYRQLNAIYPVGIFHTDNDGKNTYVNSKASEIQGIKPHETRGFGWTTNIHPEDKDYVVNTWENAVKYGIPVNIDYRFIKDGKITWVNGQTVPEYDEQGMVAGYVGILADITKQREAEEQIKQNQIEIAHFSRLNSMGEVASGIAHELNQPLTAIMNYTSGCKRRLQEFKQDIPHEILDAIDQTITQAQRAGEVIHHLKDFLRKGALSKHETDINAAIKDVLLFINRPISQADVKIKLKLDKTLPAIYADKIHIEQVIINIINNAIDAIVEGDCEKRQITISTGLFEHDSIQISIADTGRGIPPGLIDNVFNPFVTTKEDGMGIGLSLCYNIIDKHSGKISVSSQIEKGSVFYITLPIK